MVNYITICSRNSKKKIIKFTVFFTSTPPGLSLTHTSNLTELFFIYFLAMGKGKEIDNFLSERKLVR